jgi:hypothetical protein
MAIDASEPPDREALAGRFSGLVANGVSALENSLDKTCLPAPSSDYWERPETRTTLETAASVLMGFQAAERVYASMDDGGGGDSGRGSSAAARLADCVAQGIDREFGPDFTRYAGGEDRDAAIALLFPPFLSSPFSEAASVAFEAAALELRRPAGGLAPGAGWKKDGISWTPETALFAVTAACGQDEDLAVELLNWIDDHRTSAGSIPEKVTPEGAPASVAPLTWSSAEAILALTTLAQTGDALPLRTPTHPSLGKHAFQHSDWLWRSG